MTTSLTAYESAKFAQVARRVKEYSLEVGNLVTSSGNKDSRTAAGHLFLALMNELSTDSDISLNALNNGLRMSQIKADSTQVTQAAQLQAQFLVYVYSSAIAERG